MHLVTGIHILFQISTAYMSSQAYVCANHIQCPVFGSDQLHRYLDWLQIRVVLNITNPSRFNWCPLYIVSITCYHMMSPPGNLNTSRDYIRDITFLCCIRDSCRYVDCYVEYAYANIHSQARIAMPIGESAYFGRGTINRRCIVRLYQTFGYRH